MNKISGWVALIVAAYLTALIVLLPARYAVEEIAPSMGIKLGNDLALNDISGTIWSGDVGQLQLKGIEVGKASWELHPLSLLMGKLALDWQLTRNSGKLHGEALINQDEQISIKKIQGEIPVEELTSMLPFVPFAVKGSVVFDLPLIQISGNRLRSAEGEITWNRAEIVAMQTINFGDVTASFSTAKDDGNIEAKLNNQDGNLDLNTTAVFKPDGIYQIAGELAARTPKDRPLLNNFIMLGRADQQGILRFNLNGRY